MRKIIIVCALALFVAPSALFAERILGCDFDADNQEDVVNTQRCTTNPETLVVQCRGVSIDLSSSDKKKQVINFRDNKSKARKLYSNFFCQARTNKAGTDLFATNKNGVVEQIKRVRNSAPDGVEAVCSSVRPIRSCEIWKSKASAHIPSYDPRKYSTSFIARRGCPGSFTGCINVYDGDGNLVHKLGEYANSISSYDSRHYGGTGCGDRKSPSAVAALARKNTGSPEVYIKDAQGTCARIPEPTRCYNSSEC